MKYNKIALVGMMGSGKSSVSRALSDKTGIKALELDEIFEQQEGIKIKEYFKQSGEANFRKKETEILENIIKDDSFILSCGGGAVLSEKNRRILFEGDIYTIYLEASANSIYERIKEDKTRPLLLVSDPQEEIVKILSARKKFYTLANLTIKTDNKKVDEIAQEIYLKLWKK